MAKLGDICNILNGYAFKSEKYVDSGIRVIRITNVQKGYIEDVDPKFYSIEYSDELSKYMLENGDLLMSLTGNVGRVGILSDKFLPAALNQRVACLRLKGNEIFKPFLFHFLNSDYFEQMCINSSNGIAQKNLSTEWLKEVYIPEYSKGQQKQIAANLDKVTHTIDLCNAILEKLDLLVKSRFVEMFGEPISNSMGWECCELGDCLESIDNGKSYVCDNDCRTGDNPAILKLSAVTYGIYKPDENKAMIDEDLFDESAEVKDNDLLFTRKNTPELVGMSAYVFSTPQKLMMPDLIFRLNAKASCNKIYLWQLINHDLFRPCIQNIANGSAKSMSNISKERLSKLTIPVPPLALQKKFAAFVEQTDKSKLAVKQVLEKAETLKKALMQEYFG